VRVRGVTAEGGVRDGALERPVVAVLRTGRGTRDARESVAGLTSPATIDVLLTRVGDEDAVVDVVVDAVTVGVDL
jgi:hypothetical protein